MRGGQGRTCFEPKQYEKGEITIEQEKKKFATKYLLAREGEFKYAGLDKEELDTLLEKGSVQCGDELVIAKEGDEIVEIQMVEEYNVKREGGVCYLKPTKEDE